MDAASVEYHGTNENLGFRHTVPIDRVELRPLSNTSCVSHSSGKRPIDL